MKKENQKTKDLKKGKEKNKLHQHTKLRVISCALASVAQWIECWTMKQEVAGSIPG